MCAQTGAFIHVSLERTLECAPALFAACAYVCACQAVHVCTGRRISGVRNRKLSQPFGCTPNWLCAVDRMLTEHIAQTGTLFLSVSSLGFVKNISSEEFPALLIFKHEKNLKWRPLTSYRACCFSSIWIQKKGNGEAGDRSALMRRFSASYQASVVYCSVMCSAFECVCWCVRVCVGG